MPCLSLDADCPKYEGRRSDPDSRLAASMGLHVEAASRLGGSCAGLPLFVVLQ